MALGNKADKFLPILILIGFKLYTGATMSINSKFKLQMLNVECESVLSTESTFIL